MIVVESIQGGAEIDKALKSLDEKVQKTTLGVALRAGGAILLADAQQHVPVRTGRAKASLRMQLSTTKTGRAVKVGTSSKWFQGDDFYVAFLEFGHKIGKRPSKRKSFHLPKADTRKEVTGLHFVEGAYEHRITQAVDAFVATLRAGIESAIAQAAS